MATLSFNGNSFTVDHAVKGADYIHGYDAEGNNIVSIDGITDFSAITYDETYLEPVACLEEACNRVIIHGDSLKRPDGTTIAPADFGAVAANDKGVANGVATLDANSKLVQMPTAEDVGAVSVNDKGAANGVATLDADGKLAQMPSYGDVGAAAASHTHAASEVTSGTFDAARIPSLAASKIAAGTFAATGVKAATGTDYTTARVRNIYAKTSAMTAGTTSLTNGNIYLQYE